MQVYDRLVHDLAEVGQLQTVDETVIAVSRYRGRPFAPAVRISLDGVSDYLESMTADAPDVFPEVDAREGAYRLLLVHLEEALLAGTDTPVAIAVQSRGIFTSRSASRDPEEKAGEIDGDDMNWTTERP